MPRRSEDRPWIYRFLVQRDGERCALKDDTCKGALVVDEINGIHDDSRPENLRLLCRSHNEREGRRRHEREREKKYEQGSSEMWVNIMGEPDYRRWILAYLTTYNPKLKEVPKFMYVSDAIDAGSEKFEISPTTARKWLGKLTSSLGPCRKRKEKETKRNVVELRPVDDMGLGGSGLA